MNYYIKYQIDNMITMSQQFIVGSKLAAIQDDGKTDKDEAKAIKKIEAATNSFIHELEKIRDKNGYCNAALFSSFAVASTLTGLLLPVFAAGLL